jgi:hypothetical protein
MACISTQLRKIMKISKASVPVIRKSTVVNAKCNEKLFSNSEF